uniref:Gustatory receptor n=1 Tax=Anopheles farauti TaxID=69004 RepID=A0A182QD43_9DIPT
MLNKRSNSVSSSSTTVFSSSCPAAIGTAVELIAASMVYSGVLGAVICYLSLWRTDRMKCIYIAGIQFSNAKINERYYQFRNMQVPSKQSWLVSISIAILFILSLCEAYAQYKMLDAFLESLQRQSTPSAPLKGDKKSPNKVHPLSRRPFVQEHELISGERLTYMFVVHENVAKLAEFINGAYSLQIITIVTVTFVNTLFGFFIETKIFSAATSYLIVLLQFDLSKDLQKATMLPITK